MDSAAGQTEAFFRDEARWHGELAALRAVLLDSPLAEAFKWRSPCYTFKGGNVAILWSFKDSCAIGFFKGVLLADPQGLLQPPGENSRFMRVARFTRLDDILAARAALDGCILEAIEIEAAGRKVEVEEKGPVLPEELATRLEGDERLRAAFEALTPGRRRGYILHVSEPKQARTRLARIEKAAARILEGKGLHDR